MNRSPHRLSRHAACSGLVFMGLCSSAVLTPHALAQPGAQPTSIAQVQNEFDLIWLSQTPGFQVPFATSVSPLGTTISVIGGPLGPTLGTERVYSYDGLSGRIVRDFGPISQAAPPVTTAFASEQDIAILAYSATATGFGSALSLSNSPWIDITNIFAPAVCVPIDTNADASIILADAQSGSNNFISFEQGTVRNLSTIISPQLPGIVPSTILITDLADFRHVSVGTVVVSSVLGIPETRILRYDHRSQIVTLDPLPAGLSGPTGTTFNIIEGPIVSGDGLTTLTTIVDPTGSVLVIRAFNNGVTSFVAVLPPTAGGTQSFQFVTSTNETGNTMGGFATFVGAGGAVTSEAALWTTTQGWQPLRSQLIAAGLIPRPNSSFVSVIDISSRGETVLGNGNDGANTAQSFVARIPLERRRRDFNRDGVLANAQDFQDFATAFTAGNLSADWNYDGQVTPVDFVLFSNEPD